MSSTVAGTRISGWARRSSEKRPTASITIAGISIIRSDLRHLASVKMLISCWLSQWGAGVTTARAAGAATCARLHQRGSRRP